jgi:hypothetical protein
MGVYKTSEGEIQSYPANSIYKLIIVVIAYD